MRQSEPFCRKLRRQPTPSKLVVLFGGFSALLATFWQSVTAVAVKAIQWRAKENCGLFS
jgi:hypothetical protein